MKPQLSEIFSQIDPLIASKNFLEAVRLLESRLNGADNLQEICQIARALADLYRFALKDDIRGAEYGRLAGQGYVRAGRIAQAISVLHWLQSCPAAQVHALQVQKWISKSFSEAATKKAKADDDLPVPTPYQEMKGFVAFESEDLNLGRGQWAGSVHKNTPLFSTLNELELARLCELSSTRDLAPGSVLFREGDRPQAFYVVVEGEVELSSSVGFRKFFKEGEFFGEVALFAKLPRTANIHSAQGCKLLEFSEENLRKAFREFPHLDLKINEFYYRRLFLNVASRSVLFKEFSESELEDCWEEFAMVGIKAGENILRTGEASDRFYFLLSGLCEVRKDGKRVCQLGTGQFIGEIGLLRDQPRNAEVVAMSDCQLVECDKAAFDRISQDFPQLKKVLEKFADKREPELFSDEKTLID